MRIEPIHDLEKLAESMFLAEGFWHSQVDGNKYNRCRKVMGFVQFNR